MEVFVDSVRMEVRGEVSRSSQLTGGSSFGFLRRGSGSMREDYNITRWRVYGQRKSDRRVAIKTFLSCDHCKMLSLGVASM